MGGRKTPQRAAQEDAQELKGAEYAHGRAHGRLRGAPRGQRGQQGFQGVEAAEIDRHAQHQDGEVAMPGQQQTTDAQGGRGAARQQCGTPRALGQGDAQDADDEREDQRCAVERGAVQLRGCAVQQIGQHQEDGCQRDVQHGDTRMQGPQIQADPAQQAAHGASCHAGRALGHGQQQGYHGSAGHGGGEPEYRDKATMGGQYGPQKKGQGKRYGHHHAHTGHDHGSGVARGEIGQGRHDAGTHGPGTLHGPGGDERADVVGLGRHDAAQAQ